MIWVGSNAHVFDPLPASVGTGVGELETTSQAPGAVTVKRKVALRSGCSNTANTRRESGTSNWLYRYTSLSTGSTKRCRPSPVLVYMPSATTVSSFSAARSSSWMRTPSLTDAGSRLTPFRVTECTARVIASMKVEAPGVAVNLTVVVLPNVSGPVVRSRVTS